MTTSSATLFGHYDIHVDSNHQWAEPVRNVEVSVYELNIDGDGNVSTGTLTTLVHVEIHNAEAKCEDTWLSSENDDEIDKFPERWQTTIRKAIETARSVQTKPAKEWTYGAGQTVFITEHQFPGDVEYVTTEGEYVVNMANTGELAIFSESELEPYDAELWHRP